jgi:hypothetical protein
MILIFATNGTRYKLFSLGISALFSLDFLIIITRRNFVLGGQAA